jgi:hypothetical protein
LDRNDIAPEWIGNPVIVILRDDRGEPVRRLHRGLLENVRNDGIRFNHPHYVEATNTFVRTANVEFYPWSSLWHVEFDPLINPPPR